MGGNYGPQMVALSLVFTSWFIWYTELVYTKINNYDMQYVMHKYVQ